MPQTTTSDVWIVADALIGQFGTEAAFRAWHELQLQRANDEIDGELFWVAVVAAILEWHRRKPLWDETVH